MRREARRLPYNTRGLSRLKAWSNDASRGLDHRDYPTSAIVATMRTHPPIQSVGSHQYSLVANLYICTVRCEIIAPAHRSVRQSVLEIRFFSMQLSFSDPRVNDEWGSPLCVCVSISSGPAQFSSSAIRLATTARSVDSTARERAGDRGGERQSRELKSTRNSLGILYLHFSCHW